MINIHSIIEELYYNTSDNINAVMLAYKIVNNQKTDQIAIVFSVNKKKPISELAANEVLPTSMTINGITYPTDVIEDSNEPIFLTCYTNLTGDPEILRLQGNPSFLAPIKGGQEIIQFPTNWKKNNDNTYNVSIGTMGLIVIDNEDNRIVGLTNSHVVCFNLVANSQRNDLPNTYNLYEPILWADGNNYPPGALCRNGSNPLILASNYIKRYTAYNKTITNYVDAALIGLNNNITNLVNNTSYQIHQPTAVGQTFGYLPFASTSEIDNLLSTPSIKLYSTGRTTGPKGWGNTGSCQLMVEALAVTASMTNSDTPNSGSYPFGDLIRFKYVDNSANPVAGGDSGSILLADIGGAVKVIGLVFAGGGGDPITYGLACRIDRVAAELNIRAWDQSYVLNNSTPTASVRTSLFSNGNTDNLTRVIDGKTYYNIGLTKSNSYPAV